MKTIFYCLFIAFLGIYATCNKRFDCRGNIYSFEAFYKAFPAAESIRINDTIWIELNASTQLKDLMSNTTVDYSGAANFGTVITYAEIIGGNFNNPGVIPSANNFENILINGISLKSLNQEQLREFRFEEKNGMYLFKVGIVPKQKGLFIIALQNAANVYRRKDNCIKVNFSLTFKDTDQHLYLYEQKRPGYVLSVADRGHL